MNDQSQIDRKKHLYTLVESLLTSLESVLRDALKTATISHWFNFEVLSSVSNRPDGNFPAVYTQLKSLPFVEPYSSRGYSIHEIMRNSLLDYMWRNEEQEYRVTATKLAKYYSRFSEPEIQVEYIYHLLVADSHLGAVTMLNKLWEWYMPPNLAYDLVDSLVRTIIEHGKAKRVNNSIFGWGLCFQGMLSTRMNEAERAVHLFDQVRLLPELDERLVAEVILRRAEAKRILWEIEESREGFLQALNLFRKLLDKSKEANALRGLGHVCRAISDFEEAKGFYEEARATYRLVGDLQGEATVLRGLGHIHRELGELESANTRYEEALHLVSRLNDLYEQVNILYRLGDTNRLIGNISKAVTYYEQALSLSERISDRQHIAYSLMGLGLISVSENDFQEGEELYNRALEIFTEIHHPRGRAHILLRLGELEQSRDDFRKSDQFFQKALEIYEYTGSKKGQADALKGLTVNTWKLQSPKTAKDIGLRAANLYEKIGGPVNLGEASICYYYAGEYQQAILLATKVLALRNAPDMTTVAFSAGHAHLIMGNEEDALLYYKMAIQMSKKVKYYLEAKAHITKLSELNLILVDTSTALELLSNAINNS